MADQILMSESEIATGDLTASYEEITPAGVNQLGQSMMLRNTTTSRLQFRVDESDDNTFTVSPGEKFLIGGFSKLRGRKLEVRTVADILASIRINLYG